MVRLKFEKIAGWLCKTYLQCKFDIYLLDLTTKRIIIITFYDTFSYR